MAAPAEAERPLTPREASERVGKVVTVEFRIAAAGGEGWFYLVSARADGLAPFSIAVREGLSRRELGLDAPPARLVGRTVRAVGRVERRPGTGQPQLVIERPAQLLLLTEE
jgi:hypothetical protein